LAGLTARRAEPGDAPAIAHIYNQGIEERVATFETDLRPAEAIAAILGSQLERYPAVVVEREGAVVAFAWTTEYRPRRAYAGVAEVSIYVERAARGQGAGRLALSELIIDAQRRGFTKLVSRIFPENG
jgi:phosphinothricin acetyltransferase